MRQLRSPSNLRLGRVFSDPALASNWCANMTTANYALRAALFAVVTALFALALGAESQSQTREVAFRQYLANLSANDPEILRFYRSRGYAPLWTGFSNSEQRRQLFKFLESAHEHGLPVSRYKPGLLRNEVATYWGTWERAKIEYKMSRTFVRYANDLMSGVLEPNEVDPDILRKAPRRNPFTLLSRFAAEEDPDEFLLTLPPTSKQYRLLLRQKEKLEEILEGGGWGPRAPATKYHFGKTGYAVWVLKQRLERMGYLRRARGPAYDSALIQAVESFQKSHGLEVTGLVDGDTLDQINKPARTRLMQVLVGLERQRWMNFPLGERHVIVDQAGFMVTVYDDGKPTFLSKSVTGKSVETLKTPEFSHSITHMVVNPSWIVPRSIISWELLPALKRDPESLPEFQIVNARGKIVSRSTIDFQRYSPGNFPYELVQPPMKDNPLGLVKFMFPNKNNIYLHDTPEKELFANASRAFSHGCVRLAKPYQFAYHLLAEQVDDPKGVFESTLATGLETTIDLREPVPIHLVYQTAWIDTLGAVNYRPDVYGRDIKILRALLSAGVKVKAMGS